MDNNPIVISTAQSLEAINRSEVDMQVATAKQYPRNLTKVLDQILTYATMDTDTAAECFYCLKRGDSHISGPSIRMAEILASSWGNLRVQTRIVGNDGRIITAQGVCYDLERNVAVSTEVQRKITDKNGKTFTEDMQVMTGNAASAIAFRNAVFKVIPKALTKKVTDSIRQVAIGQSLDLETSRQNMLDYYKKLGVTDKMLFDYLEISGKNDITSEHIFELRGLANALREGSTTIEESFIIPQKQKVIADKIKDRAAAAKDKVARAMAVNASANTEPQNPPQSAREVQSEDLPE